MLRSSQNRRVSEDSEVVENGHGNNQGDLSPDQDRKRKKTFNIIFVSLLLDLIGFTLILPLLPSILDYYRAHDKDGLYPFLLNKVSVVQKMLGTPERFNSVLFGGMVGSLFSLLQFTSSPIIGALSDVYGRRPVLLVTSFGIASSYAVWSISGSFTLFVLARTIGGICKGNVSLCTAVVTDVSDKKTRGRGMAMIGISFSIGFIVGPLIGAYFARKMTDYGVIPAYIALTLSVLNILYLYLFFEETLPAENRTMSISSGLGKAANYINPSSLFQFKPVCKISSNELSKLKKVGHVYFLYLFLYSGLEFTLTFLTHNRFNYSRMDQGKMFFFMGAIMIMTQGGYVRRVPAGKEIKTAVVGFFLIIPSFVIISVASNTSLLYFGLTLYSLSSAVIVPCLTTVVSSCGSVGEKGTVMGIFRSIGALARAFGPIVASIGYWSLGPMLSYSIGGFLLIIPLYMLMKV